MSINVRPLIVESNLRVIKAFEKTYTEIANNLSKSLSYNHNPEFTVITIYLIYKYLDHKFEELRADIQNTVNDETDYLYYLGYGIGLMSFYDSTGTSYTVKSVLKEVPSLVDRETLVQIKNVTMADLLQVTRNTELSIKQFIRDTMTKHLNIRNLQNMGREDLYKKLISDLNGTKLQQAVKDNMIAIVDKAGRRWKVDNYVEMVARTKAQEIVTDGMKEYVNNNDGHGDLARIPVNPATVDACLDFEGLIISMTGATEGYKTYAELKRTNLIFHPSCRHTPIPYHSYNDIPADVLNRHEKVSKGLE
ncbi:MAG: phage minor capsid protein [Clostridium sp.]|uniref:phage minor capsid protein n=1 Tax=Clostridium sp. TaxID=1506 RepID=UPI0039EAF2D2